MTIIGRHKVDLLQSSSVRLANHIQPGGHPVRGLADTMEALGAIVTTVTAKRIDLVVVREALFPDRAAYTSDWWLAEYIVLCLIHGMVDIFAVVLAFQTVGSSASMYKWGNHDGLVFCHGEFAYLAPDLGWEVKETGLSGLDRSVTAPTGVYNGICSMILTFVLNLASSAMGALMSGFDTSQLASAMFASSTVSRSTSCRERSQSEV